MKVDLWVRKSPVPVEVVTFDDSVLLGDVFLAGNERVIDSINSEQDFFPFRTEDGEFQIIHKSTVARIRPIEDGRPAKVTTRMDMAPVELLTRDGKVLCGNVFLSNRERVSDVFNTQWLFVPLEMEGGELLIINKNTVVRVKPIEHDVREEEHISHRQNAAD